MSESREGLSACGLRVDQDGPVVRLTLDRAGAANTINIALAEALRNAVAALGDEVRVVVIAGSGSVFCGGGDMREVVGAADPPEQMKLLARHLHDALLALMACEAVVIAEVNGPAAGGGLGLLLHADLVIASDQARFLTAYERIGVTPDSGVSELLPRAVGLHRAMQMTVLSRQIDAETALNWGLVAEVVPHEALTARVSAVAREIASNPTAHLKRTTRLYREVDTDHQQRLDDEAVAIGWSSSQPDARARLKRFT